MMHVVVIIILVICRISFTVQIEHATEGEKGIIKTKTKEEKKTTKKIKQIADRRNGSKVS